MQHLDEGSLQAWLDGERSGLETAEIEAIEAHLDSCVDCAARAEELLELTRRAATLLARGRFEEALPDYRGVVRRARSLHRSGRRRHWTASAWAASVAVALGAGWLGNELYRAGVAPVGTSPLREVEEEGAAPPSLETGRPAGGAAGASEEGGNPEPQGAAARSPSPPRTDRTSAPSIPVDEPPPPAPTVAAGAEAPAPAAAVLAPADAAPTSPPPAAARVSAAERERDPVVRGRVVDARSGEPIQAAQVFIADIDVGVLTQPDGSFELPLLEEDVDEGPLTLTVQRIGYREENRAFSADPGDTVVMDFRVEEEVLSLDEIIVTGRPGGTQRRAIGNAVPGPLVVLPSADPGLETADGWSTVDLSGAAAAVGFPIVSVPGLDITSVEVGPLGGAAAARVRQSLGPGASLILLQARAALLLEAPTSHDGRTASITEREGVSIVGIANLPLDSLNVLLARSR